MVKDKKGEAIQIGDSVRTPHGIKRVVAVVSTVTKSVYPASEVEKVDHFVGGKDEGDDTIVWGG